MKPNILIGTPTHDDKVTVAHFRSMWRLQQHVGGRGNLDFMCVDGAALPFSRNVIANTALRTAAYTHLFFVDSDMGFEPTLLDKLLSLDKPMIGCAYPTRSNPPTYILHPLPGAQAEGDFMRAEAAGTGLLLVRRDVLERFVQQFPDRWTKGPEPYYQRVGLDGPVFQFFWPSTSAGNCLRSEDLGFTEDWTGRCGGELWVCLSETITHVGTFRFVGNLAAAQGAGALAKTSAPAK